MNSRPRAEFLVWEGIFKDFKEVPKDTNVFNTKDWEKQALNYLKKSKLENLKFQDYILPVVSSVISEKKTLKILDVGGGLGVHYWPIKKSTDKTLKLTILEKNNIVISGNKLWKNNKEVNFISSVNSNMSFDLIHFGSVIQYIDNWEQFIESILKVNCKFILFSDCFAGEIKTFVTAQNYYGSKIPTRFLNIKEFIGFMNLKKYQLIFKSEYDRTMLGKRDPLPLNHLPKKNQLKYAHHLLFKTL